MPDTHEPNLGVSLRLIHSLITRGIDVGLDRSQAFAQNGYPDAATRAGFATYIRTFACVVEGHHLAEDQVAFPYFRDKAPEAPFDRLSSQHLEIAALLVEITQAIEGAATDVEASGSLQRLHSTLTRLEAIWHPHIGIEEGILSPARTKALLGAEEHLKVMQMVAEHSLQHSGAEYLAVPFILYNLGPDDRAGFSQAMPPVVVQQLVPVVWKEQWAPMQPFLLA